MPRFINIPYFKKNLGFLIIVILSLPLFFINVKNSHDWGCDFAQYIHQAKNIIEGIPQSETGYIYNIDNPLSGPPAYTMGFPLLLSPVYYIFGNSILAFSYFISISLFFLTLSIYLFYKKHFSTLTSVMMVLIITYNPLVLDLKLEILSEIPFTLLLFIIVLLYKYRKKKYGIYFYIGIGLLTGFLMSIRQIGVVLIAAVFLELMIDLYKIFKLKVNNRTFKEIIIQRGSIIITAILTYVILNIILFHIPSNGFASYLSLLDFATIFQTIGDNLSYYFKIILYFFSYSNPGWNFISILAQSFVLTFAAIGIIKKFTTKFDFIDAFSLFYLFVILCYPYKNAGFRLLYPIIPIILFYMVFAVKDLRISFKYLNHKFLVLFLGLLILFQYITSFMVIIKNQKEVIYGPQDVDAIQAFSYIKNHVPKDAIIDFIKPRALSLYTDRKGFAHCNDYTLQEFKNKMEEIGVSYILYNENFQGHYTDRVLKEYITVYKSNVKLLFQNYKFRIYQIVSYH